MRQVDPCEAACNVALQPVQAVPLGLIFHATQSLSQALYQTLCNFFDRGSLLCPSPVFADIVH